MPYGRSVAFSVSSILFPALFSSISKQTVLFQFIQQLSFFPITFVSTILPAMISRYNSSPLSICAIHFFLSLKILFSIILSTLYTISNTFLFVVLSVLLSFSIFIHIHIQNASKRLISAFCSVYFSLHIMSHS